MKLYFSLENTKMPIDYRRSIISFIKMSLSEYSENELKKYYNQKDNIIKPYTFSVFFRQPRINGQEIVIEDKRFEMNMSIENYETAITLYNSFNHQKNKKISINKNSWTLQNIVLIPEKEIKDDKIVIKFQSFNYYGFYTGTYYPKESLVSGKLLIKQVEHYNDKEKRLYIAKAFIESASYNIYRNLTYYNNRGKDLNDYMQEIVFLRKQIKLCKDVPELMGIEGNIRKVYYDSWNIIINQDIAFEKRVKNPPDNAITLISYVNTIIYTRVLSEIYKTQLNPTISYLHEPSERRFSLCLDIAEIFKPIIADRLIFLC